MRYAIAALLFCVSCHAFAEDHTSVLIDLDDGDVKLGQPVGKAFAGLFTSTTAGPSQPEKVTVHALNVSSYHQSQIFQDASAFGGVSAPTFQASMHSKMINKYVHDDRTVLLAVSVWYSFPWESARDVLLTDTGKKTLRKVLDGGGRDFDEIFGSHIVTSARRHAGFTLLFIVKCSSAEKSREVAAGLTAKYGMGSFGGGYRQVIAKIDEKSEIAVTAEQYGFSLDQKTVTGLIELASKNTDTDQILKAASAIANSVSPANAPYGEARVEPIFHIPSVYSVASDIGKESWALQKARWSLRKNRDAAKERQKYIRQVAASIGSNGPGYDALTTKAGELERYMAEANIEIMKDKPSAKSLEKVPSLSSADIDSSIILFYGWSHGWNETVYADGPNIYKQRGIHAACPVVSFPMPELIRKIVISGFPDGDRVITDTGPSSINMSTWSSHSARCRAGDFRGTSENEAALSKWSGMRYSHEKATGSMNWVSQMESAHANTVDAQLRCKQDFLTREKRTYRAKITDIWGADHIVDLKNCVDAPYETIRSK